MKDSGKRLSEFIIEHITEMIAILDTNGRITYANHTGLHLFGIPLEDVLGKNFFDFIDSSDISRVKAGFKTLLKNSGSSIVISHRLVVSPRKRLFVESTFKNLIDDQDIHGILLSIREITETKK